MISAADLDSLARRGLSREEIERQLALLRDPPSPTLERPCRVGDGIRSPDDSLRRTLRAHGREAVASGRVSLFVPASGAATRMFSTLRDGAFFNRLRDHPFRDLVAEALADGGDDLAEVLARGDRERVFAAIERSGLPRRPKALLPFRLAPDGPRTPRDEHLRLARELLADRSGRSRVHFTVDPEWRAEVGGSAPGVEVTVSVQDPGTRTVSLEENGRLARDGCGAPLLRPGGHGALLANLARLEGDLVVVKTIDNVPAESDRPASDRALLELIGALVRADGRARSWLLRLRRGEPVEEGAREFLREEFGREGAPRADILERELARPVRVCAMVPASGEPGGGPYWVRAPTGEPAPQIVEQTQIPGSWPGERTAFFNPAVLVCALRDVAGKPRDLAAHADPDAVIVADKTVRGKRIRSLELPGLWNGGMAGWNTVFVEMPASIVRPVKTIDDLLDR